MSDPTAADAVPLRLVSEPAEGTPAAPVPDDGLTPRQRDTLARLGARRAERPTFPAELAAELRALLEDEVAGPASALPDGATLFVNKHALATIHACEARWHAEDQDPAFAVSPPVVRGAVAHKAIELGINRRPGTPLPPPADLVDAAMESLERSEQWMAEWLRTCPDDERAEVRGHAIARVTAYDEVWPPLESRWRPATEVKVRTDLAGGRVTLSGRVDLAIGRAEGRTAGKVIVDFKTGGPALAHRDDLRFYALVETLRLGVPPRAVATSYLESGDLHVEEVTVGGLEAAAARVVDGASRMVAIRHHDHPPVARPSPLCRWCRARPGCPTGQAYLDERDAADDAW
ncbi:PD-(D/E)XK nuclease family protein [Iamia sp. SCSIO 61187]|uniref:RecB family exonuclease n=1 Tax=Iamia sp. SCSIO 61187 TaxID=2722752 RepID=UPI001C636506|nr:PD-(D/E)XK nuclease family protein [Iamia sp. SCSIO 61187]QYG92132.1 PD-(D/E)XK nuclease family protein [Iamia sp. SCSIO 61187]